MMGRLLTLLLVCCYSFACGQHLFEVNKGTIKFNSRAPQELIHASSDNLKGAIDLEKKTSRNLYRRRMTVLLADHNIKIPKVVYSKLAPEINVSVNATLVQRN